MKIYMCRVSSLFEKYNEEELMNFIPEYRKNSALACKNEVDKKRSLAASFLLASCMKENNISFDEQPSFSKAGKMFFESCDKFYVNLSHAADFAVCAYDENEIGVDVEGVRDYKENVIKRVCTEEECEFFDSISDEEEKNRAFSRLWTQKESWVKLTGEGIAGLLQAKEEQIIFTKSFSVFEDCYLSVSSYQEISDDLEIQMV